MRLNVRPLLTACAVGIPTAALLAGCGGIPANAVAQIDGTPVTKAQYEKNVKYVGALANGPQAFSGKTATLIDFRPPYKACIAAIKKQAPKPQKGQPAPTDAQLKPVCEQTWSQIKQQAVASPLRSEIVEREAKDDKISVSSAEVDKALPGYLTQVLGGKDNLDKFKQATGLGVDVLRSDLKTQLLLQKIQKKVEKDAGKPTPAEVRAAYEKAKSQPPFGQPEKRNLHVVLTKTEGKAKAAKKALDGGAKFADVAKKYSIDQVTKSQGGKLAGVTKGQQERGLEQAAFGATKPEQVVGPVKTESGWYVVRVDKIIPAKVTPFSKVQAQLTTQLAQQKSQKAWTKWQDDTLKKWKDKTDCRKGYVVAFCKNAPKPKTSTQGAPGAPQQGGGQPQQAPPQGGGQPQQAPPQGGAPQQAPPASGSGG